MKQLLIILLWLTGVTVSAQRINCDFHDVSLSEALKYIQEQTTNYDITFIYDELEDFRVTTHVQSKSVPDAIIQLVGFYPVRVYKSGEREIYVECTHKTEHHLTGTIIEEPPARALRQCLPASSIRLNSNRWRREQRGWRFCHPLRTTCRSCPHLIRRLQDYI